MGTGKAVEMLCSIPSVRKDTCNTVKIYHRFGFLDQGHSRMNIYMFQCYKSMDCEGDAQRCAKPRCSEPPSIPAKAEMFVYILIVLKNIISNRQCYEVRHVN